MERIPEAELMDDTEQARAYAHADFSEPHQAFVEHFHRCLPDHEPKHVLDLGCGPADISIRFARAHPACTITGIDGARAMLSFGRAAVEAAGLSTRIRLLKLRLPAALPTSVSFDTVISNSLLHHLAEPAVLWQTLKQARGAAVLIMDLLRPSSERSAQALVEQYASDEPPILRTDFYHSLLAAYRPEEIREQLQAAGLDHCLRAEVVSDRHLLIWGTLI
jgi:ubiquinone/menaquinone biosynthesis C-methylase UbiE